VPGGFGVRGIEGKIGALTWARENKVPTLGICLGLQSMVIEFARNVLDLKEASSTEFEPNCKDPIIWAMSEQEGIVDGQGNLGGTMRLGLYNAELKQDSIAHTLYGSTQVSERHRHRYEVNNKYRDLLESNGLLISGTSLGRSSLVKGKGSAEEQNTDQNAIGLVEFVELSQNLHPYYIATQAHPEFKSRPTKAHPLFKGLIAAAHTYKESKI
jgi:CTP synthase